MAASLPLAVLLFLLLTSSAVPATVVAGGKHSGGARMVIIRRGPGTRAATSGGAAGAHASNEWRRYSRRVEDEVAPEELMIGGVLGAGDDSGIGYGALDKGRSGCQSGSQCAGKQAGGSYTRPCTYGQQCRGG